MILLLSKETTTFLQNLSKKEFFEQSDFTSFCGWKGMANYYSVKANGKINKDCAWYYAEPNDDAKKIQGRVAFWNGVTVKS